MNIRLATAEDIEQLIRMRWDFTLEDYPEMVQNANGYTSFEKECREFLVQAIAGERWHIWIAERTVRSFHICISS